VKPVAIADALLPGSGLVIDGRPAWGVPLLVPAVLILAALTLALLLGGFAGAWIMPRVLPLYAVLALAALGCRWHLARRARIDPEAVRRHARAASQAWLRGEPAAAHARALVEAAPEQAQAWRLHALVTGEPRGLKRAEAIERR
jgi:hypothetical protein